MAATWWVCRDGIWCERGDSNPHGFTRQILSLVRLPIPPLSRASIIPWVLAKAAHNSAQGSPHDAFDNFNLDPRPRNPSAVMALSANMVGRERYSRWRNVR